MITIIQNFIVTKDARFEILKSQFKNLGEILGDFKFIVNYDTNINLDKVLSLYKKNIPNLEFYNKTNESWSLVTKSLIEKCETDYIYYLLEDAIFPQEITSFTFKLLLKEFIDNKCVNLNMGKVEKYRLEHNWKSPNKKHNFIRTFNTSESPIHCLPLGGIWKKELFLKILNTINKSNAYSELMQFEKNSNLFRSMDTLASTPLIKIVNHEEKVNGVTVKEWK